MSTEQIFNCIFCKDIFDNKEDLKVHFRKHADPTFKNKSRFEVDSQEKNEKVKEKADNMVSCDVCSQMFPTISKAITHKHKVHPDHDMKYFCPWCGKLFTMKHPYNIHIQTSHDKQEQIEDKIFHCDCCDVDFFLPSAMTYHNRFFHRQDTDIPDVGLSKKLRLYNQEIVQLYYCSFCGEEYENKVNLHKHITDDHADENQSPEEVLRCPLCDAIFFHLDAYEIHLSFHTTEDLYSTTSDLMSDLLDFSLETVPPIIEKVEPHMDFEAETQSQDTDPETSANAVGIDKFLELAMEQTDNDNILTKVKKKKHKKSKKNAAITLDEFLSMNQDVFGEGLDFQGIEEVPTRVVAKKLKSKKPIINTIASAEVEKLKQKGIVVMKVESSKATKRNPKKVVSAPNRELKTSSEVLSKLINQSNNQIKIFKTSNVIKSDTGQTTDDPKADHQLEKQEDQDMTENDKKTNDCEENTDNIKGENSTDQDYSIETFNNISPPLQTNEKSSAPLIVTPSTSSDKNEIPANGDTTAKIYKKETLKDLTEAMNTSDTEGNIEDQLDQVSGKELHTKVVTKYNVTENAEDIDEASDSIEECSNKKNASHSISPLASSLSTLKQLSHLTVKPLNQNKPTLKEIPADEITDTKKADIIQEKKDDESSHVIDSSESEISPIKPIIDKDPTLDALKNLSKNITIKSLSSATKTNVSQDVSNSEPDVDTQTLTNNIKLKQVTANKNISIKKIKLENDDTASNKTINTINNTKNVNTIKTTDNTMNKACFENIQNSSVKTNSAILKNLPNITTKPEIKTGEECLDTTQDSSAKANTNTIKQFPKTTNSSSSTLKTNADILKNLPNITSKPLLNKNVQSHNVKQSNMTIKTETTEKEVEVIEISDFDDSDNETNNVKPEPEQSIVKPLQNVSKHITVKQVKPEIPVQKNIKVEKSEYNNDEQETFTYDDDDTHNTKFCSQKLSNRNMALKSVLKNLGKNITVKSRNSSPSQSNKLKDHNSQDININEHDEGSNDSDLETGKVKITELDNDEIDHDDRNSDHSDLETGDTGPIIESPHDSCEENDQIDDTDFESEIKASTVPKIHKEVTTDINTKCLNNLKSISKSLTIKSLNTNNKQEKLQLSQSIDSVEVTQNQSKPIKISPQMVKESANSNTSMSRMNVKKFGKIIDQTSNESSNQKVAINKEVTVKTFQTKTVIQEITTTVTKTIKTVNQTVNKQETKNSSQSNTPVLPQKVQGMKPSPSKNLQGVVVRHASPSAIKPSGIGTQVRPVGTVVRPSNQLVPRRPGLNVARLSTPRMPSAKTNLPKSSPNNQVMGKPLKFSPSVVTTTKVKRPNTEEVTGPFSCFKKPKESLIPVSDVPAFGGSGEGTVQFNAASHTSTSNYTSTSKIVKGNALVTATQTKSEVTTMQHQQISRFNNSVGIKVKNVKPQLQEKGESSNMRQTTLEAIEKLQKQGLLIKKPRIEDVNNEPSNVVDNDGYSSTEENV